MRWLVSTALMTVLALPLAAQDRQQTLADIRQELTVLNVEVQKLKRELSTTGGAQVNTQGSSVIDRVNAMEAELQRLTSHAEELENRVDRVVADGTRRIADLEFRLVELEGGDISKLGETSTLGGGTSEGGATLSPAIPAPGAAPASAGPELAISEEADFNAALAVLEEGNYPKAAELFAGFNQTYPGSPLAAEANLHRGEALDQVGDTREAARAYLASFTANAEGPVAPDALFQLGAALGRLGQLDQACVTLGEVGVRFPGQPAVQSASEEMSKLGCS